MDEVMTDDPFATESTPQEITAILRRANQQIETTSLELDWLEEGQHKLIGYLHTLLDLVGKLEIERNTWKFRAEEMEHERSLWESKTEDAFAQLRGARRLNAELGIKTGEARCPECGSANVALIHGYFPSGEGEAVTPYEAALDCQECGHREEMAP
jgi:DNA-directed RNA polymerase subunit RPC12/RpoP